MSVASWIERARVFVTEDLWSEDEPQSKLFLVRMLQFGIMVVEGFVRDHLLLRASGLAYFTVLSVVPLLAVAVSITSAVGVGGEPFVDWVVGMLAATSDEAQATIRRLIANAEFGGLGTVSAAFLFLTTVMAINYVESAFNGIWGVPKSRPLGRRFSDYLAVLVVGPVLGGAALSFTTSLKSEWVVQQLLGSPVFSTLYDIGLSQLPVIVLAVVYSFLYWFLPNTRVRPAAALVGGVPAAILTLGAQSLYVGFSVGAARANAVFGLFAPLAVLFVWIYAFWAIVLFGAELAFAYQNLGLYRRQVRGKPPGAAEREAIGLRIALEVGRRFRDGAPGIDPGTLSDVLHAPVRTVRDVVDRLHQAGVLAYRAEEASEETLTLAQPAERVTLTDLLESLRGQREPAEGDRALSETVESVLSELEESAAKTAGGRTLGDLLERIPPYRETRETRETRGDTADQPTSAPPADVDPVEGDG